MRVSKAFVLVLTTQSLRLKGDDMKEKGLNMSKKHAPMHANVHPNIFLEAIRPAINLKNVRNIKNRKQWTSKDSNASTSSGNSNISHIIRRNRGNKEKKNSTTDANSINEKYVATKHETSDHNHFKTNTSKKSKRKGN